MTAEQEHIRKFNVACDAMKNMVELFIATAEDAVEKERRKAEVLEALRPIWAKGYASDSVAAQAHAESLSEMWDLLGVDNQTSAMARIRALQAGHP